MPPLPFPLLPPLPPPGVDGELVTPPSVPPVGVPPVPPFDVPPLLLQFHDQLLQDSLVDGDGPGED